MAAGLHATLWSLSSDVVDECRRHPFVIGIAAGILAPEAFRRYVSQDAFYLGAFGRSYAVAAARTRNAEDFATCHGLMGGVLQEIDMHRRHASELGILLEAVEPYPETLAYTRFLLRTAWTAGIGETLAAMTPCMRLYHHLASGIAANGLPEHRYRGWIEAYASRGFGELAARVEDLLDRHAEDTPAVRDAYRYAMACERDFFTAVLRPEAEESVRTT